MNTLKFKKYEGMHWKSARVRKIRGEQSFQNVEKNEEKKGRERKEGKDDWKEGGREEGRRKKKQEKKESVIPNAKCQPAQSISLEDTSVSSRKWKAKSATKVMAPNLVLWKEFQGHRSSPGSHHATAVAGELQEQIAPEPKAQAHITGSQRVYEPSHSTLVFTLH